MIKIPILMYHSISDDNFFLSVSKNKFLKQLSFLKNLGFETINFDNIKDSNKKNFIITFDDGYKDNLINALPILKKFNFKATAFVVSNKLGKYNDWDINHPKFKKKQLMNINDIKKWLLAGFKIGSHSSNHLNLSNLHIPDLKKEILYSKNFLEKNFEQKIDIFSYPYGKLNQSTYNMVKKHYKYALTTIRSRCDISSHDPVLLPRIPINSNTGLFKFAIKFLTSYEDLKYKNDFPMQL